MKTTLEIPDFLFRRAKSAAAERGIPLRQLVTEAVQEKLKTTSQEKPWMKHLGKNSNTCIRRESKSKSGWKKRSSGSIGKSGSDP